MRRVMFKAYGGPDELTVENADEQRPRQGELLVEVEAAGANYIDVMQREGVLKVPCRIHPGSKVSDGSEPSART